MSEIMTTEAAKRIAAREGLGFYDGMRTALDLLAAGAEAEEIMAILPPDLHRMTPDEYQNHLRRLNAIMNDPNEVCE